MENETYMSEKRVANPQGEVCAVFQFFQEIQTMEVIQLFQISKYDIPLPSQILR